MPPDSEQTAPSPESMQYCFVFTHGNQTRRSLFILGLMILIFAGLAWLLRSDFSPSADQDSPTGVLVAEIFFHAFFQFFTWSTVIALLSAVAISIIILQMQARKKIGIDKRGIAFSGFDYGLYNWLPHQKPPSFMAWQEIVAIRRMPKSMFGSTILDSLVFNLASGNTFVLPIVGKKRPFYEERHTSSLSLDSAIEQFYGRIDELDGEEYNKRLYELSDLGSRSGHVAYAALAIMVAGVLAMTFFTDHRALGGDAFSRFLWGGALSTGAVALWYLRKAENKAVLLLLVPLICMVSVALTLPLAAMLPVHFGEKTVETFTLVEKDGKEAFWQGKNMSEYIFPTMVPKVLRENRKIGTERQMTVYRGPLGLASVPESELEALEYAVPADPPEHAPL